MVVDAYDAITSKRHYKEAQDPAHALREIRRCSGTHFDPAVVEVFERIYPEISAGAPAEPPAHLVVEDRQVPHRVPVA